MRVRSSGSIRMMNAFAPSTTALNDDNMLPLPSITIIVVMGWRSVVKLVIVWTLPLSLISKSSFVRSVTNPPAPSVTVA